MQISLTGIFFRRRGGGRPIQDDRLLYQTRIAMNLTKCDPKLGDSDFSDL
jgi:hypothetical protein